MKNAQYNTKDVKDRCETKLGIEFRDGKEFNGWYTLNGKKYSRITVPKGKKHIPMGTYKSMARQLNLTVSQFDEFLDCPLTKDRYNYIIQRL